MKKVNIAIAGLGTVGTGVYQILQNNKDLLTLRSNIIFEVVAVSSRSKKDFLDPKIRFYENPLHLAQDANVDIVVELIGGCDIAKDLIHSALKNNKKVVTANKALLALHGAEIQSWVDKYHGYIAYESAVAGANPVIKAVRESFVSNEITEIFGILNGTCNFILTKMKTEKQDYKIALNEAQKLGYAEADPTFDIKGNDSAHKIVLLSALAQSSLPDYENSFVEGIDQITIDDINLAEEFGYKIKLLGIYKKLGDRVQQSVYPALIKATEKIAQVDGSYNAVLSKGSNFEYNLMIGRGAGALPTGSAVVADIVDIATERNKNFLFNADSVNLTKNKIIKIKERVGQYFITFSFDKNEFSKNNILDEVFANRTKIDKVIYKIDENFPEQNMVRVALITDSHQEKDLLDALEMINKNHIKNLKFIRIEQTNF
ncbi:MAG: homoserine dehydrogenase [Alphaproteobacteria bacterium]